MTKTQREIAHCISFAQSKKIIICARGIYENGVEVKKVWSNTLTKKDRFFRLNGTVISKNMAQEFFRLGMATFP